MAPAERKKVLLKQSCSLEKKPAKSKESKEMSNKGEQLSNKDEGMSFMASKEYEETLEKGSTSSREAGKSSSKNNNNNIISNNNNSSRNNKNQMERGCSEDRGLRRRPKVFLFIIIF